MQNQCFIMRGIPGSGKSTWIETAYKSIWAPQEPFICSADHYHICDGKYEYKLENAKRAHDWCINRFSAALLRQTPLIVVDNTNIRLWEIAPYYRLAEAQNYEVEVIQVYCTPDIAIQRGRHGVPPERVREMAQSFDPLPPFWKVAHINASGK